MKVLCLCISAVLACLLASTEAAVSLGPAEVDPDRPNGCMWTNEWSGQRIFHANGGSWKIRQCERATCKREGGNFILVKESCEVIAVEAPCRLTAMNPSRAYPDCCPRPVCS